MARDKGYSQVALNPIIAKDTEPGHVAQGHEDVHSARLRDIGNARGYSFVLWLL